MTEKIKFSKSNCLNVNFGTIRPIESQVLAALVSHLKPKTIFELGTYTGFSTIHLSENSPSDSTIYTLDLPPDKTGIELKNDMNEAHRDIKNINLNKERYFHSLGSKNSIVELLGNSKTFDFSPYFEKIDFVFIDANHSYAYVKSDTENALRLLTPNGVILWHDYDFIHPGVFRLINEIAKEKKIFYIERTRYAYEISPDKIYGSTSLCRCFYFINIYVADYMAALFCPR